MTETTAPTPVTPKRRRAKGQGSVFQRPDGRWVGKVMTGTGGSRKRIVLYGKTRLEIEDKVTKARANAAVGRPEAPASLTVGRQVAAWLAVQQGRELRPRTLDSYTYMAGIVTRELGSVKLAALTADDVEAFQARLRVSGLSPNSISMARMVLGSALKRAERTYGIPNQVRNSEAIRVEVAQPRLLTPEQAETMLNALDGQLGRLAIVAVSTGLRISELLGVRSEDVDWTAGVLTVDHQLQQIHGEYRLTTLKTSAGRREVPLSPSARDALVAEMAERDSLRAESATWTETIPDLIFTTSTGQPRNRQAVTQAFGRSLAKAGLPPMHWHHLRHVFAGLLDAGGAELNTISKLLGHQNVGITARIYTGVLRERKVQAIAGLPDFSRLGSQARITGK